MKTLTREKLLSFRPCPEGLEWYDKFNDTDLEKICLRLIEDGKGRWANWALARLFTKPQQAAFAIYAAEQVLSIFEKKYPSDDRPRKAIEAARAWLRSQTKENADAAYPAAAAAAADAAYAAHAAAAAAYAAHAAGAAADAAAAAAYAAAAAAAAYAAHAAGAAADAAAAAAYAAAAAAYAAAAAADAAYAAAAAAYAAAAAADARKEMQAKIVRYGLKLLNAG